MADSSASGLDAVPRRPLDATASERRSRQGPCFVCETLAGNPDYPHHLIWAEEYAIAFLVKDPPLLGTTLVAPRAHREQVTGDFAMAEYLALQRLVYLVGEAIRQEVPTERLYVMSMGSQSGNRHVHWHVAPLPPGFPTMSSSSPPSRGIEGWSPCPMRSWPSLPGASVPASSSCSERSDGRLPCHLRAIPSTTPPVRHGQPRTLLTA